MTSQAKARLLRTKAIALFNEARTLPAGEGRDQILKWANSYEKRAREVQNDGRRLAE